MSNSLIFTSYFANVRNLPVNCCPISIAQFPPKGWSGLEYKKLAPPAHVLMMSKAGKMSHHDYIIAYKHEVLDNLDKQQVQQELLDMSKGKPVALLCYEKPTGDWFCHRKIVQHWLGISEWVSDDMSKEESLF